MVEVDRQYQTEYSFIGLTEYFVKFINVFENMVNGNNIYPDVKGVMMLDSVIIKSASMTTL